MSDFFYLKWKENYRYIQAVIHMNPITPHLGWTHPAMYDNFSLSLSW